MMNKAWCGLEMEPLRSFKNKIHRFNDFGADRGSAATALTPKFNVFSKHFTTHTGFPVPEFEIKFLVAGALVLKALGSLLSSLAVPLVLHSWLATRGSGGGGGTNSGLGHRKVV